MTPRHGRAEGRAATEAVLREAALSHFSGSLLFADIGRLYIAEGEPYCAETAAAPDVLALLAATGVLRLSEARLLHFRLQSNLGVCADVRLAGGLERPATHAAIRRLVEDALVQVLELEAVTFHVDHYDVHPLNVVASWPIDDLLAAAKVSLHTGRSRRSRLAGTFTDAPTDALTGEALPAWTARSAPWEPAALDASRPELRPGTSGEGASSPAEPAPVAPPATRPRSDARPDEGPPVPRLLPAAVAPAPRVAPPGGGATSGSGATATGPLSADAAERTAPRAPAPGATTPGATTREATAGAATAGAATAGAAAAGPATAGAATGGATAGAASATGPEGARGGGPGRADDTRAGAGQSADADEALPAGPANGEGGAVRKAALRRLIGAIRRL